MILSTALLALVMGGCAPAGAGQQGRLLKVEDPLTEPTWVPSLNALIAPSEDGRRVERIDLDSSEDGKAPVRSITLKDLGKNVALNPREPGLAYIARPESGRITVLDTDTLRVVRGYDTGGTPSYVTLDPQPELLFALSEDGTQVLGMDLATASKLPALRVNGDPRTLAESPEKGFDPALWIAGSQGTAYYGGDPLQRMVRSPQEADDIAVDTESAQRAYVAKGSRLTALEGDPQGQLEGSLEELASRNLGGKIEAVTSDALYVYAATKGRLVVMLRETLETVETVDIEGEFEQKGLHPAGISGMATGDSADGVYLTLEGEPYVVKVRKP
jgi:hypothetical protein